MSEVYGETMIAIAEPTRMRIVELLAVQPRRAGDIADALEMSGPATSRHLKVLRRARVIEDVTDESDARVRVYQLRREPFAELHSWVERIESLWSVQLSAFREHVERSAERPSGVQHATERTPERDTA